MLLNIIINETDEKFITIMEMIFIKSNETTKWLRLQFQGSIFIEESTKNKMKAKVMKILKAVTDSIEENSTRREMITFGLSALHVWCVMKS